MIISRKYVPIWILCNRDLEFRKIFDEAFNLSYGRFSEDERVRIYQSLISGALTNIDLGDCFAGFSTLMEKVDQLDCEKPYDNGLSLKDANRISIINRDEKSIIVEFDCRFDGVEQIIGCAKIDEGQLLNYSDLKK